MDMRGAGLKYYTNKAFHQWLADDGITEICVNKPNEIWALRQGIWEQDNITLDYDDCLSLAIAIASNKNDKIDNSKPLLSATLLTGERIQVIMPPACTNNTISFTIRKPSKKRFTFDDYKKSGFFNQVRKYGSILDDPILEVYNSGDYAAFLEAAVKHGKNIVVAGETNSGKTTLMKAMIDFIPQDERLITIEDTNEIIFNKHKNFVQLFYPSEAKTNDILTASSLLKSCLRMNPDRILLAELRSGETFDFVQVLSSGHGGSITSCHAGSVDETFNRLAFMIMQNDQGANLPFDVVQSLLKQTIDVVIHVGLEGNSRFLTEIYYKGADIGKS